MYKLLTAGLILATSMMVSVASSNDQITEKVSAAKAFKIEGVKLGMSKADFLQLFPAAKKDDELTDVASGAYGFEVESTPKTDGINAVFYNDKLVELFVFYSPKRIKEMGGELILPTKLVKLFGKGDPDSKGVVGEVQQIQWKIDEADFWCEFSANPKYTRINITDTKAYKEWQKKKAEIADPGF